MYYPNGPLFVSMQGSLQDLIASALHQLLEDQDKAFAYLCVGSLLARLPGGAVLLCVLVEIAELHVRVHVGVLHHLLVLLCQAQIHCDHQLPLLIRLHHHKLTVSEARKSVHEMRAC